MPSTGRREDSLRAVGDRVSMAQQMSARSRAQVERSFTGTDLGEPGIVRVEQWRPEPGPDQAGRSSRWCGVGRKG